MPDNTDTMYVVTMATPNLNSFKVRAAFVSVDERVFPGWTLLKTQAGVIAALVRSDQALLIQRIDETAAVPAKPAPAPVPTPATVAARTGVLTTTGAAP